MTTLTDVLTLATALADRVGADIGEHGGLTSSDTVRAADELRMSINRYKKDAGDIIVDVTVNVLQGAAAGDLYQRIAEIAKRYDAGDITQRVAFDWSTVRTAINEEWHKIVAEYKLQPGGIDHTSPAETLAARIMARVDKLRP